ncbi:uncharacterized protein ISCGN_016742 [Ixodes scapularis]
MADSEVEKLIEQGRQFALEGKELFAWVEKERAQRREERNAERVWRKEEAEQQLHKREEETRLRLLEMESEKELLLLQRERDSTGQSDTSTAGSGGHTTRAGVVAPHKLMPPFNEQKDDLDAYLLRFERVAEGQKWPREQWATALSLCLSGEALSVSSRMPTPDCTDYDKLRQALMLRFRMTGEGFREKFRSAAPMNGETCSQYCTRLRNFLDRWVELSQTTKDYEALFDLFLKERFLANCATPLELFLREKEDARLADMVARAEQYVEAHGWANFAKRAAPKEKTEAASPRANEKPGTPNQMVAARGLEAKRCFLCSRPGHVAQNCRAAASNQSPQQRSCFKCGKTGHPSWKCWQGDSTKPKETNRGSASACIEEGYVELRNGEKVPVVNTGLARKDLEMSEGLPVVTGLVEGERARVLRDTGCNTVIVRRGLVHDESLTGTKSLIYLLDRSVLMLPEAWVVVDTPYFKGRLRAKCMDDPIYDLILGNVEGVRRADDPDPNWSAVTAPAAPPLALETCGCTRAAVPFLTLGPLAMPPGRTTTGEEVQEWRPLAATSGTNAVWKTYPPTAVISAFASMKGNDARIGKVTLSLATIMDHDRRKEAVSHGRRGRAQLRSCH